MTSSAKVLWTRRDEEERKIKLLTAPAHFIERLKERYDLDMTLEEYHALVASGTYLGYYRKNHANSIGIAQFRGVDLWCLYNSEYSLFTTVFPPDVATNSRSMVEACFARSTRITAMMVHDMIMAELENERKDFASDRDAGIYYFTQSKVPKLLMYRYKFDTLPTWMICREIKRILMGRHPFVTLGLQKISGATNEAAPTYEGHANSSE